MNKEIETYKSVQFVWICNPAAMNQFPSSSGGRIANPTEQDIQRNLY